MERLTPTSTLREALAHIRHEVEARKLTGSVTIDFKRGEASPRVRWQVTTQMGESGEVPVYTPISDVAPVVEVKQ